MSLVFQNIDPATPLSAWRVCTPRTRRSEDTLAARAERGMGGQYLEDEGHRIALLQ